MARRTTRTTRPRRSAARAPDVSTLGPRVRCRKHGSTKELRARRHDGPEVINVRTSDGELRADPGDWIVTDERGDIDVTKPATFGQSYHVLPFHEDLPSEAGR